MKNAIWFSRHAPTTEQKAEIERLGFTLKEIEAGMKYGARALNDELDVDGLVFSITDMVDENDAKAIFGVAPTPLLGWAYRDTPMVVGLKKATPFYAAWNVLRTPEGGKPTFSHYKWEIIADLPL